MQGLEVLQLIAHDAEHIVVEQLAVASFVDQRLVVGSLHGSQPFAGLSVECHSQVILFLQITVVVVYLLQHSGVDGRQCSVGGLMVPRLHTLHGRLQ